MPFTKNFRTPAQLTGAARAAFRAFIEGYQANGLLPIDAVYDINFTFGGVDGLLPAAATYRSFDSESTVGELPAGSEKSGKLPPISIRGKVGEYQQLKMYGQNDAIGAKFDEWAIRLAQSVASRVILAQYEALVAGKVTIAERNLSFEVNFGRKAGLTANAGTVWSTTATSTPIVDVENLRSVYGRPIGRTVISRQAMTYLQANTDLMKTALGRGSDLPSRVSQEDVRSVWRDYGLGEIVINEETVTGITGSVAPVIPADKVLLLPASGPVGSTKIGVTAESIEDENGIAQSERAGLFSGAIHNTDPAGYNVLVSGIVLPVLSDPDSTAVLDAY